MVITVKGGHIGNTALLVSDEPTFTLDEQVVAFLLPQGPTWKVAGFKLGKVSILEDQVLIPLTLLIVSLLMSRDAWPFQLTNAPHGTTPDTDTEARWCTPGGGDGSPGTQCDPLAANKTVNVKYRWNPMTGCCSFY